MGGVDKKCLNFAFGKLWSSELAFIVNKNIKNETKNISNFIEKCKCNKNNLT